LKYVLRGFM